MNVVFIQQVYSLQGVKRISKVLCGAGKELQRIVLDHLQVQHCTLPCAEIFTDCKKCVTV